MVKYKNFEDTSKKNNTDLSINLKQNEDRFIYLTGEINEDKAKEVVERLLELQNIDPLEKITIIINSCGGEIYSMFAITDVMDILYPPIRTICAGTSCSAAAYIFLCGKKGYRFMTKHSSLLIHQVSGGMWGTTKDVNIEIENMKYLQRQMVEEISSKSFLSKEEVEQMIDRDCYIRPEEAIKYGMCDGIIDRLI